MKQLTEEQRRKGREANRRYMAKMTDEERKEFYRERYRRNKPRYNAQSKAWAKANPHKMQSAVHQATIKRKYPIAFAEGDITTKDLTEWLLTNRGQPCKYCGKPGTHIDHVVPLSVGGSHTWSNVVLACETCNLMKQDKTPEQWINAMKAVLDNIGNLI